MYSLLVRSAFAAPVNIKDYFLPAKSFPTLGLLINVIVRNLLTIAGILTFIIVVVAGLKVILHAGAGDSEKAGKDKGAFTAAVVGLIIIFGAYFLIRLIEFLIGFKILDANISGF